MSIGQSPLSAGQVPPPPGPAQRLAAQAGAVVYEGGNSLFDEPVLVYLGGSGYRPGMRIHNHVDRLLGSSATLGNPGLFAVNVATGIVDAVGSSVLKIYPRPKLFRYQYEISGVANGWYTMPSVGSKELVLEANNEHFGYITGDGFRGISGRVLTVSDSTRRKVGELRVFPGQLSLFRGSVSHVLSVDPGLGGELRRLLVAAPIVIEGIKQRQQGS